MREDLVEEFKQANDTSTKLVAIGSPNYSSENTRIA